MNLEPWTKFISGDKHTLDWKISGGYFLPGKEMLSCTVPALPQHGKTQRNRRCWDQGVGVKHKGNDHVGAALILRVLVMNHRKHVEKFLKI